MPKGPSFLTQAGYWQNIKGAFFFFVLMVFVLPISSAFSKYEFIVPNELHIINSLPLLVQAYSGVYIAIGTERGFMGAALCPEATDLWLIDRNPNVDFFNRINIALLAASRNRSDYLALRLKSSWEVWQSRASLQSVSKDDFLKWKSLVRDDHSFHSFHSQSPYLPYFRGANYLFDDDLFHKLSALAKNGRIRAYLMDFKVPANQRKIAKDLNASHLLASVVDVSNAWWRGYMGVAGVLSAVENLTPVSRPQTILMMTQYCSFTDFGYFGATFDKLQHRAHIKLFEKFLSRFDVRGVHTTYLADEDISSINVHLRGAAAEIQALTLPWYVQSNVSEQQGVRSGLWSVLKSLGSRLCGGLLE